MDYKYHSEFNIQADLVFTSKFYEDLLESSSLFNSDDVNKSMKNMIEEAKKKELKEQRSIKLKKIFDF